MNIRRAGKGDLGVVTGLTRRAYAHYIPLIGAPLPVSEDYAPRIEAGEAWLLEDGDEPIGLIVIEDHGDHLHIFSVAVAPERQSQGLGRGLLAFAERMAAEIDRPALTLCTNERMERNIGIYQRYGFVETGRRENPKRPGWIVVDMEKTLGAAENRRSA